MTDIEIKEANRLFWIIKGHLIPDSWSDSEIASISEIYFRRIWGNHEACYREEGFESAWQSKVDCTAN